MALSKILPAGQSQFAGARNLIINGAMQVAQRGQSFTAQGYSLDRWYHQLSGGTSTTTQETFALGSEVAGCSKYLKQATSAGDNYCGLVYKVEDVKSLPEGKATFSFYAKGTNPAGGSYTVRLDRISRVSPYESSTGPLISTVTLTSSWQRFVFTFDVPSFSGLGTIDNTSHLYISIHQPDGDVSTAAWELNLTGVQLEVGETATPFEHRSFGDELRRCQRYWCQSYPHGTAAGSNSPNTVLRKIANGHAYDGIGEFQFPAEMRAAPVVVLYNPVTGTVNGFRGDGGNFTGAAIHATTTRGVSIYRNASVTATVFTSIHATCNAEL